MDQRRNNKGYCLVTGAALGCPDTRLAKAISAFQLNEKVH